MSERNNTKESFFSRAYFYGRKNSNYSNYGWYDNNQYWCSIIRQLTKLGCEGKILDIGCAFGFFLEKVTPLFREMHGIDISSFAIERARREVPSAKLIILDIEAVELPYPDDYFNVITAFDILEHTQSIEGMIRKIVLKLKQNGYLFISVPVKDTWAGWIFQRFDKDTSHISIPTKKELFNIIANLGLEITEKHYFFDFICFRIPGIPTNIELVMQKK